jgi:hypothetical protein
MSKYLTGPYAGQEIMINGRGAMSNHWCDRDAVVFIDLKVVGPLISEDMSEARTSEFYQVSERTTWTGHHVWGKFEEFDDALLLAERLVIGSDYQPFVSETKKTLSRTEKEILMRTTIGAIFCEDINGHQLGGAIGHFYKIDMSTLTKVVDEVGRGIYKSITEAYEEVGCTRPKARSNKVAYTVSVSEEDDAIHLLYFYDSEWCMVIARKIADQ